MNLHRLVEQLEISYIRRAYSRYGNVRDAARSLGMDASTFVRKRKKIEQGGNSCKNAMMRKNATPLDFVQKFLTNSQKSKRNQTEKRNKIF